MKKQKHFRRKYSVEMHKMQRPNNSRVEMVRPCRAVTGRGTASMMPPQRRQKRKEKSADTSFDKNLHPCDVHESEQTCTITPFHF